MKENSWVTTLKRPSQNQGLERTPLLINVSFSVVPHLNRCESIIQPFSKARTATIAPPICAFAVLTLAETAQERHKERVPKTLENFGLFQPNSHITHAFTPIQLNFAISSN